MTPLYLEHLNRHSPHTHRIADGLYVSTLSSLTLSENVSVRKEYCSLSHTQPCTDCYRMLQVATVILDQTFCKHHQAFEIVSPTVKYSSNRAITKLLQMPLVSVRIGCASSGTSFTLLLEMFSGTDYLKMVSLLNQIAEMPVEGTRGSEKMDRPFVKMLLNLAQSPCERECLSVAIVKASEFL